MTTLDRRSFELRKLAIDALVAGGRGHVGSAFSLVEMLRVLYDSVLRYDPARPEWEDRDRFILSKGHGCLAFYAILADKGFFPKDELLKFCKRDGILGGHPEAGKIPGVEASTGSLGHGLSIAVGKAQAARIKGQKHRVFIIVSDGECNEGSTWEAALSAAKHKLDNLVVLLDYNKQQSYSTTSEVLELEPLADKWSAFGFAVREVDGHDVDAISRELQTAPFAAGRPSLLLCHTVKGKGVPFAERNLSWHHKNKLTEDEVKALYEAVGR
jgi:transketolase